MTEFHAPTGDEPAGHHSWQRPHSPYERYMEEQEIPIFRGIGVYDLHELPLKPWRRMGGRGTILALDGLDSIKGMYLLEVPAAGAVNPERHMFDEFMYVLDGRGTTEVWRQGSSKKRTFEWQAGSLFCLPTNTMHRLVNASSSPALVLAANNAPLIMNIFQSNKFIFDNSFEFENRYNENDDFFKAPDVVEADPVQGRAWVRTNFIPDIVNCDLPLDNQRAPGFRRLGPGFRGYEHDGSGASFGFIGQYPSGIYSKAHYHMSGAVLVCLRGKGYTYNWPKSLGPRPWEAGKGHLVKVQEYGPGGLVAAAPGGGDWFHQHFSTSKEPMRLINFWGGPHGRWADDDEGGKVMNPHIYGVEEGGRSIHYHNEDPYVRKAYKEALAQDGVEFKMDESLFDKPRTLEA